MFLGEVLSTGKVPSLRSLTLGWLCNESFRSLCGGLSRGRIDPPVMVDIELFGGGNTELGATRFAEVIRAGKLSGLRKVSLQGYLSPVVGATFGEALTHAEASLNSLEEIGTKSSTVGATAALLGGFSRGPDSLLALHTLRCPLFESITTQGAQSLSALVSGGRVPSLRNMTVNLTNIGPQGMQPFAAALSTPHVSALRQLTVGFGDSSAAAEVGMFSAALSSGHLRRLENLQVGGLWGIEGVRALCVGLGSGRLSSLRTLLWRYSRLGAEGGRALSEVLVAEKLPGLRIFEAADTRLTDEGVRALTEGWMSRNPPPLQDLHLPFNNLTGNVVHPLLKLLGSQRMSALKSMSLFESNNVLLDDRSKSLLLDAFPETVNF
uniref:Uncharacterized protein n=1 Tax=Chromera velia CCMP2878 TaxID=1169474 RepID=A0A0G4HNM6_9ALVE|eukprot:Cvel_29562.t1-p1 / transcript=Cvel_29562.t1 / gene=Cvel_29562 / organism=Chromera_velia_CCMP2878 / gene_product=hypothetical protein / transcript_product=hypothetical protein / location=Cvel_scaffold4062:5907-7040(-) / protein_length=378 / sequence_SO=supercontig / SO=protein_coding / is_pseudo=false